MVSKAGTGSSGHGKVAGFVSKCLSREGAPRSNSEVPPLIHNSVVKRETHLGSQYD